jgi:hypothetical protein
MKRLSWVTSAPRRVTAGRKAPQPRPEDAAVAEEAELVHAAWDELRRISTI